MIVYVVLDLLVLMMILKGKGVILCTIIWYYRYK